MSLPGTPKNMKEGFMRWKKHFEAGAIKYTKDTGLVRSGLAFLNVDVD